jgi:hypothetical protein
MTRRFACLPVSFPSKNRFFILHTLGKLQKFQVILFVNWRRRSGKGGSNGVCAMLGYSSIKVMYSPEMSVICLSRMQANP